MFNLLTFLTSATATSTGSSSSSTPIDWGGVWNTV